MRLFVMVAVVALVLPAVTARAANVKAIEIVEYGIYAADKTACKRDAQGIERCDRSNVRHAATTWTVPANLGVEFGLRYRIIGAPTGAQVSIKRVWLLPAPGFKSPGAGRAIRRLDRTDTAKIGEVVWAEYGFDDKWELIPGTWVLKFYYGGRELAERRFKVVKP